MKVIFLEIFHNLNMIVYLYSLGFSILEKGREKVRRPFSRLHRSINLPIEKWSGRCSWAPGDYVTISVAKEKFKVQKP